MEREKLAIMDDLLEVLDKLNRASDGTLARDSDPRTNKLAPYGHVREAIMLLLSRVNTYGVDPDQLISDAYFNGQPGARMTSMLQQCKVSYERANARK